MKQNLIFFQILEVFTMKRPNFDKKGNFPFEEDTPSINAQSLAMIMHEALLGLKFFQTKPQIKIKFRKAMICNILSF